MAFPFDWSSCGMCLLSSIHLVFSYTQLPLLGHHSSTAQTLNSVGLYLRVKCLMSVTGPLRFVTASVIPVTDHMHTPTARSNMRIGSSYPEGVIGDSRSSALSQRMTLCTTTLLASTFERGRQARHKPRRHDDRRDITDAR